MAATAHEARTTLTPLREQVNDDHVPVGITSTRGSGPPDAGEDLAVRETAYPLRVAATGAGGRSRAGAL